ncbi:TetR/AcrR family transcriptional regulator [Lentilactobacillus senioris]|uniref:TetR/AcrR family transcriptional regulator n=1 Tax=Lentilactobacillus senioris TaxID=931534 RepID=UPI00227E9D65|nr:TetR/AcrR family transcriptional regulator [Lentilactobacillus senioris]MCY9806262.1 TetR/AcrR family transcriptional regulator [Lentilactobacillus senioris]
MTKRLAEDPQKKAAILKAALHEFAISGYGASTDLIAAKAGVSKGTVFRYFANKATLYSEVVDTALDNVMNQADLTVWTESTDLVSMIVRATQYKLELAQRFPDEFALLIAVYKDNDNLPDGSEEKLHRTFGQWTKENVDRLINPVFDRLNIRPGLDKQVVRRYLMNNVKGMTERAQSYLQSHPDVKNIDQMTDLITEIKMEMDIIEHGIVATNVDDDHC